MSTHPAAEGGLSLPHPGLRDRIDRLEQELVRVRRAHDDAEARAAAHDRARAAAEAQRAELAKLLVATTALHATLDRQAVLGALREIVINLVGSEDFAVFEVEPGGALSTADTFGGEPARRAAADPIVRSVVESGAARFSGGDPDEPAACVPLALDGRVVGALAVYALLPQKPGIEPFDHEIFTLLATHAATALTAARLHAAGAAA